MKLIAAIKNFYFQLLSPKGSLSSMRFALLNMVYMAWLLIGCIAVYIIKKTWMPEGIVDWQGAAILLAAIGVFISPVIYGKVKQNQNE